MIDQLLPAMFAVAQALGRSEHAYNRAWGSHLIEDWRSLVLIADKLREELERDDEG